jgi:hypothetical protein
MVEIIVENTGSSLLNIDELKSALQQLKKGKHLITIKDIRKRSIQQNRYYWGVCVPMVRKGLYDAGYDEVKTNEDAHEVLKHVLLKKSIVSKQTGDMIDLSASTQKLSIPEFDAYVESVCKWAAEYLLVIIPSPYQQLVEFEEWVENTNA